MFRQNLMNEFADRKPALCCKLFKSFLLAFGKPNSDLNGISTSDSEMPGNVAYFISAAQESETQKDFLTARINYMKAVEELKRCTEPAEYEKLIIPVQKMYDEFVLRDPVYKYLMSKLLPIIENQNGILQSEISKDFESVDWGTLTNGNREVMKEDIYYALYFADKFGHIKRIKKGRSYQLYLPDTEKNQN